MKDDLVTKLLTVGGLVLNVGALVVGSIATSRKTDAAIEQSVIKHLSEQK